MSDAGRTVIPIHDGYRIFPGVFSRGQMCEVLDQLGSAQLGRSKAGARHILGVPAVRELAEHARMQEIASGFIAAAAVPFRATLFDKSSASNWLVAWHQDTALPVRRRHESTGWGPWTMKAGVLYAHAPASALEQVVALRVSLDHSLPENGPLRVLPDTHRSGVLTDEQIQRLAREITPVDCVAESGSVVAMRPLTVHASSKAASEQPRRVLHIEYAARIDWGDGIELQVT